MSHQPGPKQSKVLAAFRGRSELTVDAVAERLGISKACASRHLCSLNAAGLVERLERGEYRAKEHHQ